MKYFVTTFDGAEAIVEKELKTKAIKNKGFLIIDNKPSENLKSVIRAGIYLKHFNFNDLKEYKKEIKDIKFPEIKASFAVLCERLGNHNFSSMDIEIETASKIKGKVDLNSPETLIYVLIKNNFCLIGVDIYKKRLDKRDYRLKPHPNALNSALSFIALKFSNYNKKSLLDPFCGSGIIPIEAALMKGKEVYASDNQYYCVEGTRINSKIAKVKLNVSKTEINDLDKNFKKGFFDFIVTDPPIAAINGLRGVLPLYSLFLEKADYLLKDKGKLTIITARPQPFLEPLKKFKLEKQLIIDKNNLKYYILVFKKLI